MKKLLLIILMLPFTMLGQYIVADFYVLNDGAESDYLKLEKVWKAYHQKTVDAGEKLGWSVWKRTARDNDNENAAHYVVFNQFVSKEQRDKAMKNWNMDKAISMMKAGLKGKMSSRTVNSIVKNGDNLKKQDRQYSIQLIDATVFTGGDLKKGDKMSFATMTQKEDDYEQYESEVWKPVFEREVLRNNHRWWALTKIVERNEPAYQVPTHFVWNISVKNSKPFLNEDDYKSIKMQSESMRDSYRQMSEPSELTLVDITN